MCALAALYLRGGWGTFLFTMGASGALEMDRWGPAEGAEYGNIYECVNCGGWVHRVMFW